MFHLVPLGLPFISVLGKIVFDSLLGGLEVKEKMFKDTL